MIDVKFGILIEFFKIGEQGSHELHGIYDTFEEAKNGLLELLKVIEKHYGLTDYLFVDDFYIYKGEYNEIKTTFPVKLKIIEVYSERFTI